MIDTFDDNISPVEIAYGTTRILRVRQVGRIYLLEQLKFVDGDERWSVIARADGPKARDEAIGALIDANIKTEQHLVSIRAKKR